MKKEHDKSLPVHKKNYYKDSKHDCFVPSEDKSNLLIRRKKEGLLDIKNFSMYKT